MRRRLLGAVAGVGLVAGSMIPFAQTASAASQTLTIGIDNASPTARNFEFLDYYPRGGVNVHNGDVLHFKMNASPDGFHTVTIGSCLDSTGASVACADGATTETPGQMAPKYRLGAPDQDSGSTAGDGPNQLQLNPKVGIATNPPPGSGAPGACGDATTPCVYDTSKEENSGPMISAAGAGLPTEYYFKVQLASSPTSSVTVNFFCAVHGPVMSGQFKVLADSATVSTQSDLDTAAASQYAPQGAQGTAAAAAVSNGATVTNANGTRTYNVTAGTESADGHVQVLEMLPGSINITAGDQVNWTARDRFDPHTVTFPRGPGSAGVDPFPNLCESSTGDVAPSNGNGPPCPNFPMDFETHLNPQPQGATAIASATTVGTSGIIIGAGSPAPFPQGFGYSFPNAGTFTYQCRVHDHMTGQVLAATAATVTTLAQTGHPEAPRPAPAPVPAIVLLVAGICVLGAIPIVRRVRG
ncbi:MAG: cupredoxin domain-containing protein [Candidatus Dormibacteria bacterium]